jgi:hypothetical protein
VLRRPRLAAGIVAKGATPAGQTVTHKGHPYGSRRALKGSKATLPRALTAPKLPTPQEAVCPVGHCGENHDRGVGRARRLE